MKGRNDKTWDAEALDQRAVARDVDLGDVLEQPTTTADQQQQATTGVVVVRVGLEVLGEVGDALGQDGDLDLGGARVTLVGGVLGDDLLLALGGNRHGCSSFSLRGAPGLVLPGMTRPRPIDGPPTVPATGRTTTAPAPSAAVGSVSAACPSAPGGRTPDQAVTLRR